MPIQTNVKTADYKHDSGIEKGVYRIQFALPPDKVIDTKRGPKLFFKFKPLDHPNETMTLSADPGDDLIRVVWMLTGQRMQVSQSWEAMLQATRQVLSGLQWTGLGEWDGGFLRQLRVPRGDYRLKFLRYTTTDQAGQVSEIKSKAGKLFLLYDVEIVGDKDGGKWVGWIQNGYMPCAYTISDETGGLFLSENAALNKFVIAFGLEEAQLAAHKFSTGQTPIPVLEKILQANAEKGALADMFISDEFMEWDTLKRAEGATPTPGTKTQPSEVSVAGGQTDYLKLLVEILEMIAAKAFGAPTPVAANEDGSKLSEKGLYVARNLMRPTVAALPNLGLVTKWPPAQWEPHGPPNAVAIWSAIAEESQEWMMNHLGDSDKHHEALAAWIKQRFAAAEPEVKEQEL